MVHLFETHYVPLKAHSLRVKIHELNKAKVVTFLLIFKSFQNERLISIRKKELKRIKC